jgi:hypothetical protein
MTIAPKSLDDIINDLSRGLKLITERAPEYIKGRDYYEGKAKEPATRQFKSCSTRVPRLTLSA